MPLHALMFGWEYPPLHSGGLGVACQGMVRGLLKHGTRVTLVLPMNASHDEGGGLTMRGPAHGTDPDGASIITVESALQPYEGHAAYLERITAAAQESGQPVIDLYGPDLGEAVERFAAMSVDKTKDVQADVIHCHDWMTYEAGIRAAKHHRKPLVAHIHATELDRTDFQPNQWIADRERSGFLQADRIIAVSSYTKNLLVQHYGIRPDKITVVHNGHDVHAPATHNPVVSAVTHRRAPLVLFVGRLTVQKNPRQFLEMARLVHDIRPDVQFVMAGDGGMLPELMDHACALGLTDCVSFTGKVDRADVNKLYKAADCFVMPSISEPFGLVALEAIAHHTPVVLSRQSGAAEVVDHGFQVDFWDTDRFADCVLTILREEPLALQLKAEAPSILHRLNWHNQAGQILSVYRDVMKT